MQLFDPALFGFSQPVLESSQDDPIRGFGLLVSLRMFNGCDVMFSVELGDTLLETLIGELCPVVSDERLWYAKSGKHVSIVEMEDVMWCDSG